MSAGAETNNEQIFIFKDPELAAITRSMIRHMIKESRRTRKKTKGTVYNEAMARVEWDVREVELKDRMEMASSRKDTELARCFEQLKRTGRQSAE